MAPCLPAGKEWDEFKPKATNSADAAKHIAAEHLRAGRVGRQHQQHCAPALSPGVEKSSQGDLRESSAKGQSSGESCGEPAGDSSVSSCSSGFWALPDFILLVGVSGPSCSFLLLFNRAKPYPSGVYRDNSNTAELVTHVRLIVLTVHSLLPVCMSAPVTEDACT